MNQVSECCNAKIEEARHPHTGTFIMEVCSQCGGEWPIKVIDTSDRQDLQEAIGILTNGGWNVSITSRNFGTTKESESKAHYCSRCGQMDPEVEALIAEREGLAELRVWEQVAIETRACVCDCGEKWSETDLGIEVEKQIAELQHQQDAKPGKPEK